MNETKKALTEGLKEDRRVVLGKTIEYGQMMVRYAVLLNTGALVLVPSIVIALNKTVLEYAYFRMGFWIFVVGAFCGLAAVAFSFWAGFEVMKKIDQNTTIPEDGDHPERTSRIAIYYGSINLSAIFFAIAGMALFVVGMFVTGMSII